LSKKTLAWPEFACKFHNMKTHTDSQTAGPDLQSYEKIIVAFSGGKDSAACVLHLIEQGVDMTKVELWHHDIDGREGSQLMDWASTRAYCQRFADDLNLPLYFSWKVGGFEGEMLREDSLTQPIKFQKPDGTIGQVGGTRGKKSTRRMFPQVSADLSVRWCSAYLKVDVCAAAIRNDERFRGIRTLVLTGERAEESASRAKYATFEPDKADLRDGKKFQRHVDHWRPVHSWSEEEVWAIMERHRIQPAPAYRLGWGRLSCSACIFGSADQWASLAAINPDQVLKIADYEEEFGKTIHRTIPVLDLVSKGSVYEMDEEVIKLALGHDYHEPVKLPEGEKWELPSGAFGDNAGPC